MVAQLRQFSAEHDIAKQTLLEQRMLTNIMHAVRETLAWEPRADDITRKLASVRFVVASLGRHLDHMFELEEVGNRGLRHREPVGAQVKHAPTTGEAQDS